MTRRAETIYPMWRRWLARLVLSKRLGFSKAKAFLFLQQKVCGPKMFGPVGFEGLLVQRAYAMQIYMTAFPLPFAHADCGNAQLGMALLVDNSGRVFTKQKCSIKDVLANKEVGVRSRIKTTKLN